MTTIIVRIKTLNGDIKNTPNIIVEGTEKR